MLLYIALTLLSASCNLVSSISRVPCSFPSQCGCLLEQSGKVLKCNTIERCFNKDGMDAIAAGIRPDTCPVTKLYLTCSGNLRVWPTLVFKPEHFSHSNWRRLQMVQFSSNCVFAFNETQSLINLPNLTALSITFARIWLDLTRFSQIFCCPSMLQNVVLQNLGSEMSGTVLGRESFVGFPALSNLFLIASQKVLPDRVDFIMNTSASSFEIAFQLCYPKNKNFSAVRLTNLQNNSKISLKITGGQMLNLDAPMQITGFEMTLLSISDTQIISIGDNLLENLSLTSLTITKAKLNDKMLYQLLKALQTLKYIHRFRSLTIEFAAKNRSFPFDAFNSLCQSAPSMRQLSISQSPLSFIGNRTKYFQCPQLKSLTLSNCELRDSDLPDYAFSGMPNLQNIKLDGNKFLNFPKELLRNLSLVEVLSISGISSMDFKPTSLRAILPKLTQLTLSHVAISEPPIDAFIDQPQLKELTMNDLKTARKIDCPFRKSWFRNCSSLKYLSLAKSRDVLDTKKCLAIGFFDPLQNLEELILTNSGIGNQQTASLNQLFTKLQSLRVLRVENNGIANINQILWSQIPRLESLFLNKNGLSGISKDILLLKTPYLRLLKLEGNSIVYLDPETFSRLPNLRVDFGRQMFACNCELLPFTNWMREQWPIYQVETIEKFFFNPVCDVMPDGSKRFNKSIIRLLDFNISWWDCYNRKLIVALSTTVGSLICIFGCVALFVKYRWKLQYNVLALLIRHQLIIPRIHSMWTYDACFIYDESDPLLSQWVQDLVLKLETDLKLRLYEAERDAPVGANVLEEAASAIDKSRHAVLVVSRGFLENRLNLYSAQWSSESNFMRRRSLAVMLMREKLSESELRSAESPVLHRLYRMCKPNRIIDCSGCGVGSNSANRLGVILYKGARERVCEIEEQCEPLISRE